MSANAVGIGILGLGGFAMFAAQQFAQVPGAALRCIAGTHREASLACAARFGLADVQRAEVMFAMPDVCQTHANAAAAAGRHAADVVRR